MQATEFVKLMAEETQGNTDIAAPTWAAMQRIAAHYNQCPECRDAFDDTRHDEEDLIEMAARIEATNEADWICEEAI